MILPVLFLLLASILAVVLLVNVWRWPLEARRRLGNFGKNYNPHNGKALVSSYVSGYQGPPRIVTLVVVYYEAATINGVAGHRFTICDWRDDKRLGGGWSPGPLIQAHTECETLCMHEAWAQSHQLRGVRS